MGVWVDEWVGVGCGWMSGWGWGVGEWVGVGGGVCG